MKNHFGIKEVVLLLVLALSSTHGLAQSISAETLEKSCTSANPSDRQSCAQIILVYMDGFIEGVAKGVLGVYQYDIQVFDSVKDIKASIVQPRIKNVVDSSTCIGRISVANMTTAFLDFLKLNPELRPGHYRVALTKLIASRYCGK